MPTLADAISSYGASLKGKLRGVIPGAPEDQLRAPLETLFAQLAALTHPGVAVQLIGETTLTELNSRPDFAVEMGRALVGFIEVKAPGKGAHPKHFTDPHDKAQWQRLKSLPNLLYTSGDSFTLWQDGEFRGRVDLDGEAATAGAAMKAPAGLLPLIAAFLSWQPIPPRSAKQLAAVAARLCRLLRDEVVEEMAQGSAALTGLAEDWRRLLFPDATDERFADGYAQAVTFGLLVARARDILLAGGIDSAARILQDVKSFDRHKR